MPSTSFASDWLQIVESVDTDCVERLSAIAHEHADHFATTFYTTLMADAQAQHYLNHQQVKSRLHESLQHWIRQMCDPDAHLAVETIYARQAKIGEIHARTGVPVALVLKGARLLKMAFGRKALEIDAPRDIQLQCVQLFSQLMDLSMEAMSEAYATSIDQKARSSEAYRLFSLTENLATERERQRAALLDWQSKFMFEAAVATDRTRLPKIRESEFGLWFRHKGMYAFQGVSEVDMISSSMHNIDEICLPKLVESGLADSVRHDLIHQTRAQADNVLTQMSTLFAKSLEVESGKDVMTGLLNRRFLPSILTREIEFSRQHDKSFSLASIDIDYFKVINDRHGHEAGDSILVEMANLIYSRSRGGDFVFRMGGEEFLLLMVDTTPNDAIRLAQRLRQAVAEHVFRLSDQTTLRCTVSIGITSYSGHPDYQYMLRKVDRALYRAKNEGRNQVCTDDQEA